MARIVELVCLGCDARYPGDRPMQLCPACSRPVTINLDLSGPASVLERPDMWRYGALLPLDPSRPADAAHIVPIGGGWTAMNRERPADWGCRADVDLWIKDEGRGAEGGAGNPTGSFKDRGMAMTAAMAHRFGIDRLVVPTQGNAGDSLVAYARAAGIQVAVVLPDDTPAPILDRVRTAAERDPGVRCDLVRGTIREAGARVRERYLPDGWFSAATFAEPGWRIEGKKTLGLEIAEQLGSPWRLPDAIVYPTGGGTGILGMWKAFGELEALGLVSGPMPRFICVQSAETAPLVEAWSSGASDSSPVEAGHTVAVGLNVPGGVGHFRVLDIVRRSGGVVVAVDEARLRARSAEWAPRGIGPEGAACIEVLDRLYDDGMLKPGDTTVVVNTCGPEKYA